MANLQTTGLAQLKGVLANETMKRNFEKRRETTQMHTEQGGSKEDDMDYNARKRKNQDEIDAILDKIRKSGYDSLTKEEKQKLFDASRNS